MSPEVMIKRYEKEMCSNCKAKCTKGIVIFTQTVEVGNEIKEIVCAKCVDYERKDKAKRVKPVSNWQSW